MSSADMFVELCDWRNSLYRGEPAVVDQFLNTIDGTLPVFWIRDHAYEQSRTRRKRIHCYLFEQAADASVRLWLDRVSTTRVRGGPLEVLRHAPSGDAARITRLVGQFTDDCVLPAADGVGIRRTRPSFGPLSVLGGAAETLLNQFADTADGQWPLSGHLQDLWDELVSGCLAEHVAINRDDLEKWVADSGWGQKIAAQIADQFFADSRRLAKWLAVAPL